VVQPSLLLIPLLGFDSQGYRLGYGGGYYDRTLAALRLKPLTIGIGYEAGRLETIQPQPHDIPLDAVVTESGITRFDTQKSGKWAASSPPCYLHEFDDQGKPE
jgi:5-formyltetrahydrofolate cyclo-ligase